MNALSQSKTSFSILDWMGLVVATMATISLMMFPVFIAPHFRVMYADFGGEIPVLTHWVLNPWFAPVFGAASAILIGLGLRGKRIAQRRMLVVTAFGFSCASFALVWVGLYLPILNLAAAIQ